MKQYIVERVYDIADYILDTGSTVRCAGKKFAVSKSTVHKDMTERLTLLDKSRAEKVKRILNQNLNERHYRGGQATKEKFEKSRRN